MITVAKIVAAFSGGFVSALMLLLPLAGVRTIFHFVNDSAGLAAIPD